MGHWPRDNAYAPPTATDGLLTLTSRADMLRAEALWRELDARSTADLVWFQSFDWCNTWMVHHAGPDCTPHVVMILRGGRAVAVLPLMRLTRPWGLAILRPLGEPHTQYANILTVDGTLDVGDARLIENALQGQAGVDGLVCQNVPAHAPLARFLVDAHPLARLANHSTLLDLTGFRTPADYLAALHKNSAKNLKRRARNLAALGPVSFRVLEQGDEGFAAAVRTCLAMKQTWLTRTGRINTSIADTSHQDFLTALGANPTTGVRLLAFVLTVDGSPAAVELGFLQRQHYYSYMGAYRWRLRQHAPGRLQMHDTIGWLITEGVHAMDLLAVPTDYKREFASTTVPLLAFSRSFNIRGLLYARGWVNGIKPVAKGLIARMPESLRTRLAVMKRMDPKTIS